MATNPLCTIIIRINCIPTMDNTPIVSANYVYAYNALQIILFQVVIFHINVNDYHHSAYFAV